MLYSWMALTIASVAGDDADEASVSNCPREMVMVSASSADHHTVPSGMSVTAKMPSPCSGLCRTSTNSLRQPLIRPRFARLCLTSVNARVP